jgi:hypothetical protein
MSDGDAWTAHDVTDGRLFCYATSLWLAAMAALLLLVEIAVAVGATVPASVALITGASFGLLLVGVYYERFINGLVRAVVWLNTRLGVTVGDRA